MVYVPFKVVRKRMIRQWMKDRELPRPTVQETEIEWFKMLDWLPPRGDPAFRRFKSQFPLEDRGRISR